jgi:hypothetical protein
MLLELVLNEEEKKERFAAHLARKKSQEPAPDIVANSNTQTRFREENSSELFATSVIDPIYSTSPQRSSEFWDTHSTSRALVCPSLTPASSYNNLPTGTVSPIKNTSWTSDPSLPLIPTNTMSLSSMLQQNTSSSSIFEQNTSLSTMFEQNASFSSRFEEQSPLSFRGEQIASLESEQNASLGSEQNASFSSEFQLNNALLYSRMGQNPFSFSSLFVKNSPGFSPYQNMPPLQPVSRSKINNSSKNWKQEKHGLKVKLM